MVAVMTMMLSGIGEIKAALGVEDDVVGGRKRPPVHRSQQRLEPSAPDVQALDRAAGIVGRRADRNAQAVDLGPFIAAVVADDEGAVGGQGRAIGAAADPGDDLLRPVGRDPRHLSVANLDDQRGTVGQDDRSFWKRSEEHTSELQSLMRNTYAVFC